MSFDRIEQLANEYAERELNSVLSLDSTKAQIAERSPEEAAQACENLLELERVSALKLLGYAERKDFHALAQALKKHNQRWRKLFCEFSGIESLPATNKAIEAFLREWIGEESASAQIAERERQERELAAERERKESERKRAECLKGAYRWVFSESGGISRVATFVEILDYLAQFNPECEVSNRGAFPVVNVIWNGKRVTFRKSEEIKEIKSRFPERETVNA